MITLEDLLSAVWDADAETIFELADTLILPEDQADFELAAVNLWVKEGEDYRKEIAVQMGWGCVFVGMAEEAIEANEGSKYFVRYEEQELDLHVQKVTVAQIIEEYILILKKEGRMPKWVVMDGKLMKERVNGKSKGWLRRCFEVPE